MNVFPRKSALGICRFREQLCSRYITLPEANLQKLLFAESVFVLKAATIPCATEKNTIAIAADAHITAKEGAGQNANNLPYGKHFGN